MNSINGRVAWQNVLEESDCYTDLVHKFAISRPDELAFEPLLKAPDDQSLFKRHFTQAIISLKTV